MQRYLIGDSPMPAWCRKRLLQYKSMDGTTGFELWYNADGMQRFAELKKGDEVYRLNDGRITFKRKVSDDESKT